MYDCDGSKVLLGSRHNLYAIAPGVDGHDLRTGYRTPAAPLPYSWQVILRDLIAHPRSTLAQIGGRTDSDPYSKVARMVDMEYISLSHRHIIHARMTVTPSGVRALQREPVAPRIHLRVYEAYVPPKAEYVRRGAEDNLAIASRG